MNEAPAVEEGAAVDREPEDASLDRTTRLDRSALRAVRDSELAQLARLADVSQRKPPPPLGDTEPAVSAPAVDEADHDGGEAEAEAFAAAFFADPAGAASRLDHTNLPDLTPVSKHDAAPAGIVTPERSSPPPRAAHAAPLPPTQTPTTAARPVPADPFPAECLSQISAALAVHLGPVARILVNRFAVEENRLEDLVGRLVEQIPNDDERVVFRVRASQICQSKACRLPD